MNLRLQGRSRNILAKPGLQTHRISPFASAQTSDLDALHSGTHCTFGGWIGTEGAPRIPPDSTR